MDLLATDALASGTKARARPSVSAGPTLHRKFDHAGVAAWDFPEPDFGAAQAADSEPEKAPGPPPVPSVDQLPLTLFALQLDNVTLTDAIGAYGDPANPLLPVSELARLLSLDLQARPSDRTLTGTIGESRRSVTVDLDHGLARVGGTTIPLDRGAFAVSMTDIFLSAAVLERLLPLKIAVDDDEYSIRLMPTEKLPLQARSERQQRVLDLRNMARAPDEVLTVASPYRWIGRPSFDINLNLGSDDARGGLITRLEGRIAADLLKTNFTGFFSTDDAGRPSAARLLFQRRDSDGNLLGPLHATYLGVGDVFSPSLALGPRSFGGAGVVISTARTDEGDVFQRIDLRGELPVGYDVELYINDVLYAGQSSPIVGRYEFRDVPLVRGANVVRVVTYGPHGERDERTRVVNVGGGQLAAGRTSVDLGIIRQDAPVVQFADGPGAELGDARGKLRFAASVAHGLSPALTVTSGLGLFTDRSGKSHQTVLAGARGSLLGTSFQLDLAKDFNGGSAMLLGAAGRFRGISVLARHAEYRGNFIDENSTFFDLARPSRRHSQLLVDFSLPFVGGQRLPISGDYQRTEFRDGGTTWSARTRTTLSVADTLVGLAADYRKRTAKGFSDETLTGTVALSRLVDYKWQLRASVDYEVLPKPKVHTVSMTVDREITQDIGLRLGIGQTFESRSETSLQAGVFGHLPFGEISLNGNYTTGQRRWQVGVQMRFGLAYDPWKGGYRFTPPGPANGGSAALLAFTDNNGNNRLDPDDIPIPGIVVQGGGSLAKTDSRGQAFVTGLGESQTAVLRTDTSAADTVFAQSPPQTIEFQPRAGEVVRIPYPFYPTSEVDVHIATRRSDGSLVSLSSVQFNLVPDVGEPIPGATEFDGNSVFEAVRPGQYRLELDLAQRQRLGISLVNPVSFKVDPIGGRIAVSAEIAFEKEYAQ